MATRARRWLRQAIRAALVAALVLLVLAAAGAVALPGLLAYGLNRALAGRWDGRAHVQNAWLDLSGNLHVTQLTIDDALGRTWLAVPSAQVKLLWSSLAPRVGEVNF